MTNISAFVDSDVVISSFISNGGAAHFLLNNEIPISLFVLNYSVIEIHSVCEKLNIDKSNITELENQLNLIEVKASLKNIKDDYGQYVLDINDAHIIGGAHKANCKFLISYNLKDNKIQRIKNNLGITVITPGSFLQYLRGLELF